MKTIHKYPIQIAKRQTVVLPAGAQILTAGLQRGELFVWALIDPEKAPSVERRIEVVGTGFSMFDSTRKHIGTVLSEAAVIDGMMASAFVWHVFELP